MRSVFISSQKKLICCLEPILSIITTTFNSESTIERCIRSLTNQDYPRQEFEIIVVDDGSSDKTIELAKKTEADVVIETGENKGIGVARNTGVQKAKGKFLAFIDSDCEAKEGWIKTIINELKTLDVITGPIENGTPDSLVAWAEYFVEFVSQHKFRKRSQTRHINGGNGALSKNTFFKAGGFTDSRISEDVIFSESLRKAGIKKFFIPEMQILNLCGTDMKKLKSKMKVQGNFFVRVRRKIPTLKFSSLVNSRWLILAGFFGKITISFIYALKARRFGRFIRVFPLVIITLISFCRGISEELKQTKH